MKSQPKRILVTAALPYANGLLHLGHLAGAYLPADMYVRYQRAKKRDVLFLCGSDEHGVAITVTAEKEKITPQAVVDRYHSLNKAAFDKFGMSFDNYSRTSLPLHHATAQEFFAEFHRRGVLKEKEEQQLYCEKDRMFLADRYVEGTCPNCKKPEARGDQCENCGTWLNQSELIDPKCKLCGTTPVVRTTSHWYFPLGDFQKRLVAYVKERSERDGWKDNVLRYCESWFKDGLQDRAVTRDLSWGVPVPVSGYEKKVLYVWFDAVLGYISSGKEWAARIGQPEKWKEYWLGQDTKYVAFIGKDNVVFHCIVFPAMLMAWNDSGKEQYILPENVPANEFLNFEGQKFSKSRGWGIDLENFLNHFPADSLRYTLAINLPESRDSDFYLKDFQARTNNELADIFGNFVNRTLAFTEKNFGGAVPVLGPLDARDADMAAVIAETPAKVGALYERYKFREAVIESMNLARAANKYFNDSEPWKSFKSNPEHCATTLNICLQVVRSLAILMEPVVPSTARKIWETLNLEGAPSAAGWESAGDRPLQPGHTFRKSEILVTKIEDEQIDGIIKALNEPAPVEAPKPPADVKPLITIDDFKKVELKLARVVSAELVPKSNKLLKVQLEIGTERRQVVAGIAQHYKPEDLVGKMIVVVTNLQPAKLMGQESNGMLLAASDSTGKLAVLTVNGDLESGAGIK
ncbi:MAG: methionine--tRNA ligase [Ignavibacteriales bacterium]|nr:methionine--tRNA ligase [Ignavibacteriales bacterium]